MRLFSSATGLELYSVRGTATSARVGESVAALDDVDGDGTVDFVAGSLEQVYGGAAIVYSGAWHAPQTFCTALEFEWIPVTLTTNRICNTTRICSTSTEYQTLDATPTSNRVCAPQTFESCAKHFQRDAWVALNKH